MRISDWSSDVCSSDLSSKRGSTEKKGPLRRVPSKSSSADAIANASLWHSVMASLSRSLAFVPGIRSSSQTDARSDRKSVVEGKCVSVRVELGGRGIIKKKKKRKHITV